MMDNFLKISLVFLILSIYQCSDDYIDIEAMVKTEFNVNQNTKAYFRYYLGDAKGPIGIHFHLANLYTVQVSVYKSNDEEEPVETYKLAEEQFKEIDASEFGDYVYIIIEETYQYFYKDYITIYNPNEVIQLKLNEVLTISNFLSNNKYTMILSSLENVTLVYNTFNSEKNKRKITITNESDKIIEQGEDSQYKIDLSNGEIIIEVENDSGESEEENPNQEFSLIIYENKYKYNFNKITTNVITKTNYIFNNEVQTFYYYADISNKVNFNTINFKLNFKYYLDNSTFKFSTKIINLEHEIEESDFEDNIPSENDLPSSYDVDSDEYYRIYFHDENKDTQYKYLLVKLEITENESYSGSKSVDVSLGDEVENFNLMEINYNKAITIDKKLNNYIPTYFKLILNTDDIYLLTSQNHDLSLFIKGDLLNDNNTINENYMDDTNDIMILSGIKELTVKLFGSSSSNLIFYVERINPSKLLFAENNRNNEIFEIKMNDKECSNGDIKYILGSYNSEDYSYGQLSVNYYATIDSGDFEVYYKNTIDLESDGSLFPIEESKSREFNKRIVLDKSIDLFTIKCKKAGTMSIRPEYKSFDETTHLIEQNSIQTITLYDFSEIVQLSTNLGQKEGTVYFSLLSLNKEKLTISPDTPGVFEPQTIQDNQLFLSSADLSKYKMDQLAIKIEPSSFEINIEVTEIIHNDYNTYKKLKKGNNEKIALYNVYYQINEIIDQLNVTIENLQNKHISYGVIKSASNDENYLTLANNYPNTTNYEIKENSIKLEIDNIYYNKKDDMKPYLYFVLSVLEEEKNLEYNINLEIEDINDDDYSNDDDNDKTILIVVMVLIGAIMIGVIALILFMIIIRRKNRDIDNEPKEPILLSTQNPSEVDP